jgi:hypothetical protein
MAAKRRIFGLFTKPWQLALLLAVASFVAYDPTRLDNTSGDNISNKYWPVAILKHGTFEMTPFKGDLKGVDYAAIYEPDGRWLPRIDMGMILFSVPFYEFADLFGIYGGEWTHDRISHVARLNSLALAVAAVVLMFFFLLKFVDPEAAFVSALIFAFGSWNWSLGPQGINPQTVVVFLHLVSFFVFWSFCHERRDRPATLQAVALGILHGLVWSVRVSNIFLLVPFGLVIWERKRVLPYLTALGATCALNAATLYAMFGHWMGFRGVFAAQSAQFQANVFEGLFGLLFSPNRGAIVFFPVFLLVPFLWWKLMPPVRVKHALSRALSFKAPQSATKPHRSGFPESLSRAFALGAVFYFISFACLTYWHCTWSFGARYYYDFLPYLWPPIALGVQEALQWFRGRKSQLSGWVVALLAVFSLQGVLVHGLGHRNFDIYVWNSHGEVNAQRAWNFDDWMMKELWNVGSNARRWEGGALDRLRRYGF